MSVTSPGRYDSALRRRMLRKGRESGGSIYISGEELAKTGFAPGGELPFYRVWAAPRGRIVIQLYARR